MRLLQHTRYHKPVRAPYAAHFGRWLGRPLLKCEKRLITALEYRRLHGPTKALRCVVCAPDGEKILLSYLRYFAKHLYRNDTSAVIMPNAELAERRARL